MAEMRPGANVALTREVPGLRGLVVGVGWSLGGETALGDSLVLAAILCGHDGRAVSGEHFVFFNQLVDPARSVSWVADPRGSDAEQVEIDLTAVPQDVARVVVVLYLNRTRGVARTLGQLRDLRIRLLDLADDRELVRSANLAEPLSREDAVALGAVYRHGGEWKFRVLGDAYTDGIVALAADYGVPI